ncbi:Membrane glyco [Paramuricea clavata]|uniref:Membrane glyco n=1 Tax=Paramuricea clavata TaxID=317549 RepID=A0A6S7FEU5_PARCT|nr:Membrane glyco [Paramuricea clavata]
MVQVLAHAVEDNKVGIILVSCAMCSSIQCDLAQEYQLVQNKTSREILKCSKCRPCKPGSEPEPPCGSVVGVTDLIGICNPCKDGFYSANEDMLQCQRCQSATCFTHQIVVEICKKDEPDTSRCTSCQKGYVMNSNATACVVDKQQTTTGLSTVTTKGPTLSNKTDGETGLSVAKTGLSVAEIILIVICSLLIVTLPFVGLCCHLKHRNTSHTQRGKDEENSSANISTITLSNGTKDKGNETIIPLQEEDQRNGLSTSDGPHVTEPTAKFVNSSQPTINAGNEVSDTPLNNIVANNGLAISPEPLIPQSASAAVVPNYLHNNPHLTVFDDLSLQIYDEICGTFDGGAPLKDWRALAGWLDLTVKDVKGIEIRENNYKTSQVIQRWAVATENTVAKFVKILEEHGMTCLADKINNCIRI